MIADVIKFVHVCRVCFFDLETLGLKLFDFGKRLNECPLEVLQRGDCGVELFFVGFNLRYPLALDVFEWVLQERFFFFF